MSCEDCANGIKYIDYEPYGSIANAERVSYGCLLRDNGWNEIEYGPWDDDYQYDLKTCPAFG